MLDQDLVDRYRALRRRPTLRAEVRAAAEAAVVSVEFATEKAFWLPAPPLPPRRLRPEPSRLDRPSDHEHALAGCDVDGRPVLIRSAQTWDGEQHAPVVRDAREDNDQVVQVRILHRDDRRLEVIGFLTFDAVSHVTWIDYDESGRPTRWATAGVEYNDWGKGGGVTRCCWDGDRPLKVVDDRIWDHGTGTSHTVHRAEYDADGLVRVHTALDGRAEHVEWSRASDAYDPGLPDGNDAIREWVELVPDAARRLADDAPADTAVIKIRSIEYGEILTVTTAELAEATQGATVRDAVHMLGSWRAGLHSVLDDDGKQIAKALRQHRVLTMNRDEGARLARALADITWPNDAIAIAYDSDADPYELAAAAYGPERFARLLESGEGPPPAPAVTTPPASEDELRDLLEAFNLDPNLANQARWGAALLTGGTGISRLGGIPELPTDTPWPHNDGEPLRHLATIDLSEVPAVVGLPANGRFALLFDTSEEAIPDDTVDINVDGSALLVPIEPDQPLHQPPTPPDTAGEYDIPLVLNERYVRFEPVLTMPERPRGLTEAGQVAYQRLYWALIEVTPGLREPAHLLGGHPAPIQHDHREPHESNLLSLGWDEDLRFEYLDGGSITILGPTQAIQDGSWIGLRLAAESS